MTSKIQYLGGKTRLWDPCDGARAEWPSAAALLKLRFLQRSQIYSDKIPRISQMIKLYNIESNDNYVCKLNC